MRAGPRVDMKVINVGIRNTTASQDSGGHSSLTALDTGELGPAANGKMLEASPGRGTQDGNIINQDWTLDNRKQLYH